MKAALQMVIGLIFDDWWLGIGLLVSIALSYFAIRNGMNLQYAGWMLLLLIVATLLLSLIMEFRKKSKSLS
ncbi:hypothetical protein [Paenibacillus aestuarii]|uniref:Uncharacterized protein n=1 Tax=Paenibacillus aestuarii TaxID=516965 RepID=A0ABW0KJK3_9BACL|nr:hypothetical protein [Paenibacillus aestuarii]